MNTYAGRLKKIDTHFLAALVSLLDDENVTNEDAAAVRKELAKRKARIAASNSYTTVGGARGQSWSAP